MKFAVTYCAMDPKAEANPMWHACILLSKMDEATNKLEVVDTWSFYGLPSTDKPGSLTKKIKVAFKIDVNLQGNHGKWRHEETRYLDRGVGLHGRTFEVTEEQFNTFAAHMQNLNKNENDAIAEAAAFLKLKPKAKPRIYEYEDYSDLIFHIEKVKAEQEKRESRLKPFELRMGLGLGGPTVKDSHTCKSQAISALRTVLSKKQIEELTEFGKHPTVPRYSGPSEEFYLYSTGPVESHPKKSGAIVYFRKEIGHKLGDDKVRAFWALPPQKFDPLSKETSDLWSVDKEHVQEIKGLISKLIRLEWALVNAVVPENYKVHKELLMKEVVQCYNAFAIIQPKPDNKKIGGLKGFVYSSLFGLPCSAAEEVLYTQKKNAKQLLNALYFAIVDGWSMEEDSEDSKDKEVVASASSAVDDKVADKDEVSLDSTDVADYAVLNYCRTEDKKAICTILGRSYMEPSAVLDSEEEELRDDKDAAMLMALS